MSKTLKSTLISYIFCIGIILAVTIPISCINTNAATINVIATSTKEACNKKTSFIDYIKSKLHINNLDYKSKSMYTVPVMEKTISKYIVFAKDKLIRSKIYIKNSYIKARNIVPVFLAPSAEKSGVLLANLTILFFGGLFTQVYLKKNAIKVLMMRRNLSLKYKLIKTEFRYKINLFNTKVLNMLKEEVNPIFIFNKKARHSNVKCVQRKKDIGVHPILLGVAMLFRVNYINRFSNKAFRGLIVKNTGLSPKFVDIFDSS